MSIKQAIEMVKTRDMNNPCTQTFLRWAQEAQCEGTEEACKSLHEKVAGRIRYHQEDNELKNFWQTVQQHLGVVDEEEK